MCVCGGHCSQIRVLLQVPRLVEGPARAPPPPRLPGGGRAAGGSEPSARLRGRGRQRARLLKPLRSPNGVQRPRVQRRLALETVASHLPWGVQASVGLWQTERLHLSLRISQNLLEQTDLPRIQCKHGPFESLLLATPEVCVCVCMCVPGALFTHSLVTSEPILGRWSHLPSQSQNLAPNPRASTPGLAT